MVSIKDIAAEAKVSIGTIDRVLHNRGRVSKATKANVEQIIQKLGYRPNVFARNLSLAKEYCFGIVMPRQSQDCEYWKIPVRGIERATKELSNHKVKVRYYFFDRYSERSFADALRKSLAEHSDGLLVAPVLPHAAERAVPEILEKTPVVFFDSPLPGTGCLSIIGQDSFQSGLLASHLMQNVAEEGRTLLIVRVTPGDFHIDERIRGFLEGLGRYTPAGAKVYEVDSHQGEQAFRSLTKKMLSENDAIGGVFVSNAWVHPIARNLHADPRARKVCVIGYDLVEKNIACLEQGSIDFLISQRPEMQGYEGIYCLFEHVVLREKVRQKIMMPIDILTKDNVQYYQD